MKTFLTILAVTASAVGLSACGGNTTANNVAVADAAVLYDGDRVLGGGWIEATEPALIAA